jgi:N-acetylglucosaminyl-diphospho-decaprenol L-rhamnosyltransferase
MTAKLSVSLVSHGHGLMAQELVVHLLKLDIINELIVTLNIPEEFPVILDKRLKLVRNSKPKGFGQNHNDAFAMTGCEYFCVLNPDIVLVDDPFPALLSRFNVKSVGLVAPIILSNNGSIEDSMRKFLTPWSMVKRVVNKKSGVYVFKPGEVDLSPDWVAGMFMLFSSEAYTRVGGFDDQHFMYCEDTDICTRLWKIGYSVLGSRSASVIHNAQRASHKSFKHLSWHIRSIVRYFVTYALLLPRKLK